METPPESAKGAILCADDDEDMRSVLDTFLTSHGYHVILVRDGHEAVAMFKKHLAELVAVVLDLRMPRMDGLEAAREIRKISPHIPLIALSAYLGGHDSRYRIKECQDAGFNAYLTKPFSPQAFLAVIEEGVRTYKTRYSE